MNFKEILELIDKVADRGIGSVEIERAGEKVRITGVQAAAATQGWVGVSAAPSPGAPPQVPSAAPPVAAQDEVDAAWHIITSPIVGTFYRAPNPESDPFVNPGDAVGKGSVLCIIEAMKLMNEIESDVDGVIMKIFPQNAQPVEYGEKLFAVKL